MERRPRLIVPPSTSTLAREVITWVILALAAWSLPACNGAGLVLKSPLNTKCQEAGLKKCPEMADAVIAYAGGEKAESRKKITEIAAANEPQRIQQFAEALEVVAGLPGLGAAGDTLRDLAESLKGDQGGGGSTKAAAAGGVADVVGVSLVAGSAAAAPAAAGGLSPDHAKIEALARALQKKAMDTDFLNVDFKGATDKLNQAIAKCGTNSCIANLRALLRRDLATIYSAASKKDDAVKAMVEALKIDGTVQVDPNYKTKELDAVYAEAKGGVGAGGIAAAGGGGAPPAGDFTHTPPTEEAVRTPLPLYVEYGGTEAVTKVVVKYKAFGMSDFKTLELKKVGVGFGANIPCIDILEGSIQYYVQGFTANNDPVATSGDGIIPSRSRSRRRSRARRPISRGRLRRPSAPTRVTARPTSPAARSPASRRAT